MSAAGVAELQSKLSEGRYSSKQIDRLYRRRTRRRDHAQVACKRVLIERLYGEGVATVYVGDLTDVLETHWSVRSNTKTHNFWAFRAFVKRLACTAEEVGITVEVRTEAWTSQTCPNCGSTGGHDTASGHTHVSVRVRGSSQTSRNRKRS